MEEAHMSFASSSSSSSSSSSLHHSTPTPALQATPNLCYGAHHLSETIHLLSRHHAPTTIPKSVFYRLLRCCTDKQDVASGRSLYNLFTRCFARDAYLVCHFIRMFSSCGSLVDANKAFRNLVNPNVYAWGAIINAHVRFLCKKKAFELYLEMIKTHVEPDGHVFVAVIKACACKEGLLYGREIHRKVRESGLKPDIVIDNALIDMYMKCGILKEASEVFEGLKVRNVVTWNVMISGHALSGHTEDIFHLFIRMLEERVMPNCITFSSILKTCCASSLLCDGKLLHSHCIECGCERDVILCSSLVDMYAKCGSLENAQRVFDKLSTRTVVTWTTMIAGYSQHDVSEESLKLLQRMLQEGIEPNAITIATIVKACASGEDLAYVRLIHIGTIRKGFESDLVVGSALVDAYSKHSSIEDAYSVFDGLKERNVVTWSAIIGGCAHTPGHSLQALQLFQEMQSKGIAPDTATFVNILRACSNLEALEHGRLLYFTIIETGFECQEFVISSVIDMYAKCRNIDDARNMFDKLQHRDMVIWSSMISGYVLHGHDQDAIKLFHEMVHEGFVPDTIAFISTLKSCSNLGALLEGKLIHSYILESKLETTVHVGNSLIDMYTICGCIEDGKNVFNGLQRKDNVSWTTMVSGYALTKNYNSALKYFQGMQKEGWKPDGVSLVSVLSACSREARLLEGCQHFEVMNNQNVAPTLDHYNCMIDLLGHAGHLEEAIDLLQCMPFMFDVTGWVSLLSHCRLHSNVEIGRHCFDHVVALNGKKAGAYMLMHNLYKNAGMKDEACFIEKLRLSANAWKKPGQAAIEVDNKVYDFFVSDRRHPQRKDIYDKLYALNMHFGEEGYNSLVDTFVHPVSNARYIKMDL